MTMKKVCSVSGGRTSAYLAANYEWDYFVFSLVRIEDEKCRFKDEPVRKLVEDRLGVPFIGTSEDDMIIYTMLDLEQYLGREIKWVTGETFEWVLQNCGGWLPNVLHRYCTTHLKLEPIFYWWANEFHREPVEMGIGYRANEDKRVKRMQNACNADGLNFFDGTFEKNKRGQNKWETVDWRKPIFPLYDDRIFSDEIHSYWKSKPVRFADYNNCTFCFHRNSAFLRQMYELHPEKLQWASDQEGGKKGYWKEDASYEKIIKSNLQLGIFNTDSFCDDGFCEVG
jgi:hypothetical protein